MQLHAARGRALDGHGVCREEVLFFLPPVSDNTIFSMHHQQHTYLLLQSLCGVYYPTAIYMSPVLSNILAFYILSLTLRNSWLKKAALLLFGRFVIPRMQFNEVGLCMASISPGSSDSSYPVYYTGSS